MVLEDAGHSFAPMDPILGQHVTREQLEQALEELQALPGDPAQGFFGPGSKTWQVNRECGVFLGAGRAALLQGWWMLQAVLGGIELAHV